MKIYLKNQQKLIKVNHRRITNILRKTCRHLGLHKAELSILLVNDRRMRVLNRSFRGVDRTTDVLSFPQTDVHDQPSAPGSQHFILGDIVINLHKTERQAQEYGHSFYDELNRLLIHGLLHLIGYDHEKGKYAELKMQQKAEELHRILAK
ncbi:MAG: rRNA maturation RNase YbeY [Thermodesulfovibrionales bacterium]|nr:rRNA maturation RNase YbeY [Thermodesulfovibrionales bacterium]